MYPNEPNEPKSPVLFYIVITYLLVSLLGVTFLYPGIFETLRLAITLGGVK